MNGAAPRRVFPVWASIFTFCGIVILCGLGTWQVQRLAWKTALLAQMDEALAADPMAFPLTAEHLAALDAGQMFVHGFARGSYLYDAEIAIGPRTHDGQTGYHVITPLQLDAGGILLVNRGWISAAMEGRDYARPQGNLIVTGTVRRPEKPNGFVPPNAPAQDQWYRLLPDDIARAKHLNGVLPYILYAEKGAPGFPSTEALTQWRPPNNHLSYAIFWFLMAFVLALIYGLRFFVVRRP